jgi:phage gp29-like protein
MDSYDNPYGESILSRCYWPWRFKYGAVKCLAKLIERSGIPWVIGKYVSGMEKSEQDELLYQLTQMREGGIIILPDTFPDLEVKEIDPQSTQIFTDALSFYNSEISKVISIQTLSTEIGDSGSYAAAKTHHDREGIPQQEIRIINLDSVNRQLIQSILNVNPQFKSKNGKDCYLYYYEEDDARESWAKTLDIASKSVYIPAEVWGEKLQIEVKEYEKPAKQTEEKPDNENPQESTDFARQQKSENLPQIEDRYEQDIDESIRVQVEQIISMVNNASSYEEMLENVSKFSYNKETEKVIRESSTLAWLAGVLDVLEEAS